MIQSIAGLGFSFVGTVLVALSVKKGEYMMSGDHEEYTALFKIGMLKLGLVLLGVGFLLQIWGVCIQGVR